MNLKKVILVVGGVSLLGMPLFLIAIGAVDLPTHTKPENLIPLDEWLGKKNAKLPSEDCDQSATTTPCAVLQAMKTQGAFKPEHQTPQVPMPPKNVALTQVYTDVKLGFSFKYPDGYEIREGDMPGQIVLVNTEDAQMGMGKKVRGIKIDASASGGGFSVDYLRARPLRSLSDFQVPEIKVTDPQLVAGSDTKELTKDNTVISLPSGVKVLSQKHGILAYNVSGNVGAEPACDGCEMTQRYILFKDPRNYIVITPILGDANLESKIIQSIEYK